jgi:hypothetical protein
VALEKKKNSALIDFFCLPCPSSVKISYGFFRDFSWRRDQLKLYLSAIPKQCLLPQVLDTNARKEVEENISYKTHFLAGRWWLTPVIPATWEADIRRIVVQGQPGKIVCKTPSPK